MLWLLLAASVVMLALAVRARRLERAEGLATSRKRLAAVGAVCGAVAVLVLGATAVALLPPRAVRTVPSPGPAGPTDPAVAARREALEEKLAKLRGEGQAAPAENARYSPRAAAPP